MRTPVAPQLDERRAAELEAELRERARAWLPGWDLDDDSGDFGGAILKIAARFGSEVTERLDGAGEKMRRGLLDWLGVRGQAARPARMPVVFKLTDGTQEPVLASAPVRMQADAAGTPVVFETEKDVRVLPGRLEVLVGVDADQDAFYLPAPGLSDLSPSEPLPTKWQLKSFAAAGSSKLQLEPAAGLAPNMLIEADGQQYRVTDVQNEIVSIEPSLLAELSASTAPLQKVTRFAPFDPGAENRQEHALYLGDLELLNIEAAATLEIVEAGSLVTGFDWQYWGKLGTTGDAAWQAFTRVELNLQGGLVLSKPAGAIEPRIIGGHNARWIRAFAKTVAANVPPFSVDALSIRINALGCDGTSPCPPPAGTLSPISEGMANTTPLVLENVFFPLGKQPRQFDAFYLGSQEAFSKINAQVALCFELADPTFSALSAVREGRFANGVLAGVGQDRALHLLQINAPTGVLGNLPNREALQPPLPSLAGNSASGTTVQLDKRPTWRLPVWGEPDDSSLGSPVGFAVATSAGDAIWIWREFSETTKSGWLDFGSLPAANGSTPPIAGLVYLAKATSSSAKLLALRGDLLFERDWPSGPNWAPLRTKDGQNSISLASIAPAFELDSSNQLVTSVDGGMVGISKDNKLFAVSADGACTEVNLGSQFNLGVCPAAIKLNGRLFVAAVDKLSSKLRAFPLPANAAAREVSLDGDVLLALEVAERAGKAHFLATLRKDRTSRLVTWAPYETGAGAAALESIISGASGDLGSPTLVAGQIVVPGGRADVLVNSFLPSQRVVQSAAIETGIILTAPAVTLAANDLLVGSDGSAQPIPDVCRITRAGQTQGDKVLYPLDSNFAVPPQELFAFASTPTFFGTISGDQFTLDVNDHDTAASDIWLLLGSDLYFLDGIAAGVATISPILVGLPTTTADIQYARPVRVSGRVVSFMELSPSSSGNWDADLLARFPIQFPEINSGKVEQGRAFSLSSGNHPQLVLLDPPLPAQASAEFVIDTSFGDWHRELGDTTANPELSWEYWNGKGWWTLDVSDDTLNLKATGTVRFRVPPDLASSDWAGKTNHWIRARLVGGDYGREKVTVISKPLTGGGGGSEQTVERSSEGIRAPSVLRLFVSYAICSSVQPTFVLAQDSGSIRDQSDANRTGGAIVEAFVSLAHGLGRLSGKALSPAEAPDFVAKCGCDTELGASNASAPGGAQSTAVASGRAIYVGLSATLSEAPVNLLLLVEERAQPGLAPMIVEALTVDRFVPIVANDVTRALSESGVLTMAFAVPPTRRELFGQTLSWLRLTPAGAASSANWQPKIRGAYLNAAWASATETLTRELAGSSDGSPNLTVTLARPPLLHHSLELRVNEPLGEEERTALRNTDEQAVLSAVESLPGDWVLWKQVDDPSDEPPGARVYALNEATGEIRFGDALHGRIPPIGRDSIVAFSYQRTEPGPPGENSVPANLVAARTPLNLISPVASVESAIAADQAAGGSPVESDARVLRFGFSRLRHRNRAVTASDIEELALQSSPDFVQARASARRNAVRLVVVAKGSDPSPTSAQVRELRRALLAAAPGSLALPGALNIQGPVLRRLRLDLRLRVSSLDDAGSVARAAKQRLTRFFDTGLGGVDEDGFPLGVNTNEDDVALALLDLPHLDGIEAVNLREVLADAAEREWPSSLKATELVTLAEDPLRIQFQSSEAVS